MINGRLSYEEVFQHTFMISLRDHDRSAHTLMLYGEQGIFAQVIEGVDGQKLPDSVLEAVPELYPQYSARATKAKLGCVYSHLSLHKLVETLGVITIVEDDSLPAENFAEYVRNALEEVPDDWEALQWATRHATKPIEVNDFWNMPTKMRSTLAYSIRGSAVEKYRKAFEAFPIAADNVYDHPIFQEAKTYCISPTMVLQQYTKSNISNKMGVAPGLRSDSWLRDLSKEEFADYVKARSVLRK